MVLWLPILTSPLVDDVNIGSQSTILYCQLVMLNLGLQEAKRQLRKNVYNRTALELQSQVYGTATVLGSNHHNLWL